MVSNILTTEDSIRIKNKLTTLKSVIFNIGEDLEKTLDKIFSNQEKESFKEFFANNSLKLTNNSDSNLGIEKILEEIEKTPTAVLTLAYVPSVYSVKKISGLINESAKQPIILNINTNPRILGGALIEYQGKFEDYSLVAPKK